MDSESAVLLRSIQSATFEITKEMRRGVFPAELLNTTKRAGAPTQMLVHGYCSDGQVWQGFNVSTIFYLI